MIEAGCHLQIFILTASHPMAILLMIRCSAWKNVITFEMIILIVGARNYFEPTISTLFGTVSLTGKPFRLGCIPITIRPMAMMDNL